ncbi:MAG TPA: hypothetical protein VLA73_02100 [Burkholderiales bacterium]|nr:hypothetical protein [Burkholderiales bacterium]
MPEFISTSAVPAKGSAPMFTAASVEARWVRVIARGIVLCSIVAGCATVPEHDAGLSLAEFNALPTDYRILYEPGAEVFARRLAPLLPGAVAEVEAAHYRPFAKRVAVHICGTAECFNSYVPEPTNLAAAVVFDNRVLLHPRLFTHEPDRLEPILVHELSHLHLGQRIGHYSKSVPVWFHEGLASLAAKGGGADLVSEEQARQAILAGKHFDPAMQHGVAGDNLSMALFYRQCLMFVARLQAQSATRFRELLLAIQRRESFDSAFTSAYGHDWVSAAREFFAALRE